MNRKALIGGLIALAILVLLIVACVWLVKKGWRSVTNTPETAQPTTNAPTGRPPTNAPVTSVEEAQRTYLAFGNPSNATQNTSNADNYLMVNNAYALSYNNSRGSANWVAWRITASDFGVAERQNDFRPDPNLPKNFTRITPADYTGSGFDRGHLCPSADRSSSEEANSQTFFMTNMTPQTPDLNRNVWNDLETYSRDLVKKNRVDLYVIAGCYGEKGKLKKKVSVPTNCWKVIVPVPPGADFSVVNADTQVTAVDLPNTTYPAKTDWRKYRTTVRAIEGKTNLNLLSNLPQNLQDTLETKADNR